MLKQANTNKSISGQEAVKKIMKMTDVGKLFRDMEVGQTSMGLNEESFEGG